MTTPAHPNKPVTVPVREHEFWIDIEDALGDDLIESYDHSVPATTEDLRTLFIDVATIAPEKLANLAAYILNRDEVEATFAFDIIKLMEHVPEADHQRFLSSVLGAMPRSRELEAAVLAQAEWIDPPEFRHDFETFTPEGPNDFLRDRVRAYSPEHIHSHSFEME